MAVGDFVGMRKVAIATVSRGIVPMDYTVSLVRTLRQPIEGLNVIFIPIVGHANVPRARNILVAMAKEQEVDDIVFIDDDIGWNPEEFVKLFNVPSDVKIVAGCPQRRTTSEVQFCGSLDPGTQLAQKNLLSGYAATAFMRISMDVFADIPSEDFDYTMPGFGEYKCRSYFDYSVEPNISGKGIGYMGEDYYFCKKAKEAGHEVWLRPGIRLAHINAAPMTECMADHLDIIVDGQKLELD